MQFWYMNWFILCSKIFNLLLSLFSRYWSFPELRRYYYVIFLFIISKPLHAQTITGKIIMVERRFTLAWFNKLVLTLLRNITHILKLKLRMLITSKTKILDLQTINRIIYCNTSKHYGNCIYFLPSFSYV